MRLILGDEHAAYAQLPQSFHTLCGPVRRHVGDARDDGLYAATG